MFLVCSAEFFEVCGEFLFHTSSKEASQKNVLASNSVHVMCVSAALYCMRPVEELTSKGCLLLAEEVGSGVTGLHAP